MVFGVILCRLHSWIACYIIVSTQMAADICEIIAVEIQKLLEETTRKRNSLLERFFVFVFYFWKWRDC